MSWLAVATVASAFISSRSANKASRRNDKLAREQMEEARLFRQEQQALLEEEKDKYNEMVFNNPFEGMENPFEDLTVNTQQAEFQARRGLQNRVNILDSLRSAAGSSGIAGLAQTLANQGLIQTEKISASIGKQETANRLASAKGALQTELADAKGEFMIQNMEASRRATTLGMQQGVMAAAVGNEGQAKANQMSSNLYGMKMRQDANQNLMASIVKGVETWDKTDFKK